MGFRRRRRAPQFWPQRRRGRLARAARPIVLAALLAIMWAAFDPLLVEPPGFLAGKPERVSETFSRCGRGRSFACVIDGDTFKLGKRRVRIIGIDSPETQHSQCPAETTLGEQATAKLQQLLNQGPFEIVAPAYGRQDRYGRDLRVIRRTRADGSTQSIAGEMRESGLAHRYMGGFKPGWC